MNLLERMRSEREKNSRDNIYSHPEKNNFDAPATDDWSQDVSMPPGLIEPIEIPGHPAAPCPTCRCPSFWEDPYGRPRCCVCVLPPASSMVRRMLLVIHLPDGAGLAWEERPIPAWLDRLKQAKYARSPAGRRSNSMKGGF